MLYEILMHIRNFFPVKSYSGKFTISDNMIDLPFLIEGQYYKIEGSVLNDGIYCYGKEILADEVFAGNVLAMAIPREFLALVAEIEEYKSKNAESSFVSESFGNYSYTKGQKNGVSAGWKEVFASRLNSWRKL